MDVAEQELSANVNRIAVIGGGLVGALAALSVAKLFHDLVDSNCEIHVFERYSSPEGMVVSSEASSLSYVQQYDARNLVISSATARFFRELGIWDDVRPNLVAIDSLDISRVSGRSESTITAKNEGVEALGYTADMSQLAAQLSKLAAEHTHVRFSYDAQLRKLLPKQFGYELEWGDNAGKFDLVIAADGENSWVCAQLGIFKESKVYDQQALVANVSMDRAMSGMAYERFTDGGAITLLPLTQHGYESRMALVWIDDPKRLKELNVLSETAFLQQLARALPIEPAFLTKGHSKIYPLRYQVRHERVRPHLVLVGNAAQTLHPIAAQGFNLAVRDIQDFVMILRDRHKRLQEQESLFSGEFMSYFAHERDKDVRRVRTFVNGLDRFFFQSSFPFLRGVLQDLALFSFEHLPGAKATLSRFAMGGQKKSSPRKS